MGKNFISTEAGCIKPSAIRKIFNLASTLHNVVNFGIGEPDFDTPEHIVEAAKKAMADGFTHYSANAGFLDLRECISDKLKRDNGITADPETQILATCGGMGGLYLALRSVVGKGDEVIVPQPSWVNYEAHVSLAGGMYVPVLLKSDNGFFLTSEAVEKGITRKTKAILLNSPCNPTGKIIAGEELHRIALLADKYNLVIISDEVYEKFVWDGNQHSSIGAFPEAANRTITVNSFSKSYAMTGWRIGYAAGNAEIIAAMVKLQENIYACPSTIAQKAAVAALNIKSEAMAVMLTEYDKRRRFMSRELAAIDTIRPLRTEGSFYLFTDISATRMKSEDFAMNLLKEEKVAVVPGNAFGETGEGFVRLSFAASLEKIREGVDRIKRFIILRK